MTRRQGRRSARGISRGPSYAIRLVSFGASYYFDAAYGCSDNGTASAWEDRVAGYTVASTSQATRLTYSSSVAGLNGRPGWAGVTASSTKLVSADGTLAGAIDGSAPYTMYTVRKVSDLTPFNMVCCAGSTTATEYVYHASAPTTGANFVTRRVAAGQTQNGGSVNIGTALALDTTVYDGSTVSLWTNGTLALSAGANTRAPTCDRFVVGALLSAGVYSLFLGGSIGDIVIFLAAHDASQRAYVWSLLSAKYGGGLA